MPSSDKAEFANLAELDGKRTLSDENVDADKIAEFASRSTGHKVSAAATIPRD
jgi:hypothetical protein